MDLNNYFDEINSNKHGFSKSEDLEKSGLQWDKARVKGVLTPLRGLTIQRQAEIGLFKLG